MSEPIVTPAKLIQAFGLEGRPPVIGATVVFNLLQTKVEGVEKDENFFGARHAAVRADLSVLSNIGMGGAMLAFYFEMARQCGARQFILLGTAGALWLKDKAGDYEIGDLVRPDSCLYSSSVVDHYLSPLFSERAQELQILTLPTESESPPVDIEAKSGCVWSTEALFRETPALVGAAFHLGARWVDMETATLFTLGGHYKVPVVSYLIISDLLSPENGWHAGFRDIGGQRRALLKTVCSGI